MTKQKEPIWLKIVRIALACVFLYSGFTKAIDACMMYPFDMHADADACNASLHIIPCGIRA